MSERRFYVPGVEVHSIDSRRVAQTYEIQVMQPLQVRGESAHFPVLYIPEGNAHFDALKGISHALQAAGQVRRFILVGISYPGDNPFAGSILRGRDLTPDHFPDIPGLPSHSPIEGVPGIESGRERLQCGADFLAFIREEVVPLVDRRYPTLAGDRAYFGHSLGGGLGLHALFCHDGLFNKYVISSPGLSWEDDDFGLREARVRIARGGPMDARLFLSVAENEEFEPFLYAGRLVSSVYRLAAMLRMAQIPGLEFCCRIFSGETHVSVWPAAFTHGVQAIYGRAEGPLMGIPSWARHIRTPPP